MKNRFINLSLVVALIVYVSFYIGYQIFDLKLYQKSLEIVTVIRPIKEDNSNNIEDKTLAGLTTYRNEELGIEFEYPERWGEIKFTVRSPGSGEGFSGRGFSGYFSNVGNLYFGGLSKDFSAPRGANFLSFWGISGEAERDNPAKIIILESGDKAFIFFDQEIEWELTPSDRGARVYLKGPEFFGIAFIYEQIPQTHEESFDKMIGSIKFIRQ